MIAPNAADDKQRRMRNIERDFAVLITPGLHLAFSDREKVRIAGRTIADESATREIWVAGPAAFGVLKALAFRNRGENKEAYDLFYVLRYFDAGLDDIARRFQRVRTDVNTQEALDILREDFTDVDSIGPMRVAEFLTGGPDDVTQADARGVVLDLMERLDGGS